MKILVTGSNGFIAKNFIQFLSEKSEIEVLTFSRDSSSAELEQSVFAADWIVHLAGINRPLNEQEFIDGNITLTQKISDILKQAKKKLQLFFLLLFRRSMTMFMERVNWVVNRLY